MRPVLPGRRCHAPEARAVAIDYPDLRRAAIVYFEREPPAVRRPRRVAGRLVRRRQGEPTGRRRRDAPRCQPAAMVRHVIREITTVGRQGQIAHLSRQTLHFGLAGCRWPYATYADRPAGRSPRTRRLSGIQVGKNWSSLPGASALARVCMVMSQRSEGLPGRQLRNARWRLSGRTLGRCSDWCRGKAAPDRPPACPWP